MTDEALAALMTELDDQERRLQLTRFDNDTAWRLGEQMVRAARAEQLPITISVVAGC